MKRRVILHCHHEVLAEISTGSIRRRRQYIREHKPADEQAVRLRLIRYVDRGDLPRTVVRAMERLDRAWAAYDRARAAHRRARVAHDRAWVAHDRARAAHRRAWVAYDRAWASCQELLRSPMMERWHKKHCPGCPWDGKTIFPGGVRERGR